MAFFDNLGKKASAVTSKAMQKAQDFSETAKLNSMISDEEKKINDTYLQIGKKYVDIHGEDGEDDFAEMLAVLKDAEQKISGYRQQIQDMKEVLRCEKCGAEISKDSAFCSNCGAQIVKKKETTDTLRCKKCGAAVTDWMRFCTSCGNPLPQVLDMEATDGEGAESRQTLTPDQVDEVPAEWGEDTEELVVETSEPENNAQEIPPPQAAESGTSQTVKRVCPHCGAEGDDDQLFCIECGNRL